MTQKQLFEILKNKFENLEFICSNYDENKFCFIYSDKLKFFSYHNDADKVLGI
jgi:hypothetical protein